MSREIETAEQRFREAFQRLKEGKLLVLVRGTPVSQNNVAKEAGVDPSALRKSRYPSLTREIQAFVELASAQQVKEKQRKERRQANRESLEEQVETLKKQRDKAQSELVSAHRIILELMQTNARLQIRMDELQPPPTRLK